MNINVNKVKIFVTVPEENTNDLREEICKCGAGIIGEYTNCTFLTKGIGTFMPNDNANPYIGKNNELEFVNEDKLEVICDIKLAKEVIKRIREVHPYEEPAIDIFPLIDEKDL